MAVNLTSPITGAAQTGFTSPTYTLTADLAPMANGRQWAVTALGGTQAGVTTHASSSPFTITAIRPLIMKGVGVPNPNTGVIGGIPMNTFRILVRKGARPAADQAYQMNTVDIKINVAAGTDNYDPSNVRAMLSAAIGALSQVSAGIGDTATTGIL